MRYNLVGIDGNAYSIMSYVSNAMRDEGKTEKEVKEYQKNATSSDYNHLIYVSDQIISELNKLCGDTKEEE